LSHGNGLPVWLVYSYSAAARAAALRREWEIKSLPRAAKRALCTSARARAR
jgi:predicted GIY-YIG superfamily endonuclease